MYCVLKLGTNFLQKYMAKSIMVQIYGWLFNTFNTLMYLASTPNYCSKLFQITHILSESLSYTFSTLVYKNKDKLLIIFSAIFYHIVLLHTSNVLYNRPSSVCLKPECCLLNQCSFFNLILYNIYFLNFCNLAH